MEITSLRVEQGGFKFWLCRVKLKDLLGKCRVDANAPGNPEGYQREVIKSRAKKFGIYIKKGGFCPVNVLVNIREDVVKENERILTIPDHCDWWLVDGQHRFEGLRLLCDENPSLREIDIPVALMNLVKSDEAKQFLIINKTQKGVRTDLAERIIYTLEQQEGKDAIMDQDLPVDFWKSEAVQLVDLLTETEGSPLFEMIKRPGETGFMPLRQVSVTSSLKPVLDVYKGHLSSIKQVSKALMNLWGALKEVCPECFDEPKEYLLLKTPGVFVTHKIFATLLPTLCAAKEKDLTKRVFVDLFTNENCKKYFEYSYWDRSNPDGVSRYGTSQKSYSMIFDLVWSAMANAVDEVIPEYAQIKL